MKLAWLYSMLFIAVGAFSQSPWLPEKGGFYYQFSYITVPAYNTLFTYSDEPFQMSRSVSDKTLQFYGEHAVSDKFSVLASVPYKILDSEEINQDFEGEESGIPASAANNAFGNSSFSLKYKIAASRWVSAAQVRVGLPAGQKEATESGLYPGYDAWSVAPVVSLGKGWNNYYFYTWLSGIVRSNQYSEYLNGGLEGGWKPMQNLWFISYFELMDSFRNGSRALPPPEKRFGLYANDNEYTAFGFKLIYEYPVDDKNTIGVIAHAAGSFSGFMVAHSPLISFSIFFKR